jgi:RimJ/RimL family protein N-acetyltransferase
MSMPLPTPSLQTSRLRLRAFEGTDANNLFALQSNAYVLRYWDAPPWTERTRAEKFNARCREMEKEGTGARLAVNRVSDGALQNRLTRRGAWAARAAEEWPAHFLNGNTRWFVHDLCVRSLTCGQVRDPCSTCP